MTKAEINEAMEDAAVVREFAKFNQVRLSDKQLELYHGMSDATITTVTGPPGTSKAQPLDAKILTPQGWVCMCDLKVGDLVITASGEPTPITGIYPYGMKEVYTVSFSDGAKTACCLDHLWKTQTTRERNFYTKVAGKKVRVYKEGQVRTTKEIMETLNLDGKINHTIPITAPVKFIPVNLPLDPYLLGALLGDGGLTHRILFSSVDKFIIDKVDAAAQIESCKLNLLFSKGDFKEYSIVDKHTDGKSSYSENKIRRKITELGLFGKKSADKFIPSIYLTAALEDRISLLRGLMDTDGTTSRTSVTYCTVSARLRDDIIELVRGLGGIAKYSTQKTYYTYKGKRKQGQDAFVVSICLPSDINPFSLPRKADKVIPKSKYKPTRYITDISYRSTENVQCISVQDDSHLYLTDDYIVTHNTFTCCYLAMKMLKKGEIKKIILTKPLETSGEDLGFLPGTEKDKVAPFLASFIDNLKEMVDGATLKMMLDTGVIEFVPIAFMRGRTFKDAFIIADEIQNLDIKQLMTFITRMGVGSKVAMIGDSNQNDINKKFVALDFFIEKILGEDPEMFHYRFNREDIVRHPLLIKIVDNYERSKDSGDLPETKKRN